MIDDICPKCDTPKSSLSHKYLQCDAKLEGIGIDESSFRFGSVLGPPDIKQLIDPVSKSASKNDKEKVDLSLIPYISQLEHARAFMVGEKKYGRYNYCKGHKVSQLVAAIQRHTLAYFNGEEHDLVDGQHHLGSVMACCSMLLRQKELGTLKDDRYKGNEDADSKK